MLAENHYRLGILFNLLLQFTVIKQYLFRYKENEKVALILGIPKETECETELRTIYDWIEDRGKV